MHNQDIFNIYLFLKCCIKLQLCPLGVRKDHSRVLRHGKRRTGSSNRVKAPKDLEHRTVTPQDRRKHSSSSGAGGGRGKPSDTGMPPDQVLILWTYRHFKYFDVEQIFSELDQKTFLLDAWVVPRGLDP